MRAQSVSKSPCVMTMWIHWPLLVLKLFLMEKSIGITSQPPCCTGIFPRGGHYLNHWQRGVREAIYHSLTQHSAFDGSLDDRVERDQRLWKRVHSAEFARELAILDREQSGMLVNLNNDLEFQTMDYKNCPRKDCSDSVMALWEVKRMDHSNAYRILIKLLDDHSYIEDAYQYTYSDGLKHLGADNSHKPVIYHYTVGSNGKHNIKYDSNLYNKPVKFPVLNKSNKHLFGEIKKKDPLAGIKSNTETTEEDSKVVKIEPRKRYRDGEYEKHQKQGTVVPYIPNQSEREFQSTGLQYDGFIPSLVTTNKNKPVHTTEEKEYDSQFLKLYHDAVRRYFERNHPKPPPDFRPSKPYTQYSEPDPLYPPQTFASIEPVQNKYLIVHKYPDSINAQLPPSPTGDLPTIPYISVTVSNRIPVQNVKQSDTQSTTPTTTTSSTSTTTLAQNTTNDVEEFTVSNNTITVTSTRTPKTISNTPETTKSPDISKEELTTMLITTTSTTMATILLEESNEDSKIASTRNRNLIKKDTINSGTLNNETTSTTIAATEPTSTTMETQTQTTTTTTKTTTKEEENSTMNNVSSEITEKPQEITTESLKSTSTLPPYQPTIPTIETTTNDETSTTTQPTTTINYLDETRNHLANLLASLTFDLINARSLYSNEDPNYSVYSNSSEIIDDDESNEEIYDFDEDQSEISQPSRKKYVRRRPTTTEKITSEPEPYLYTNSH